MTTDGVHLMTTLFGAVIGTVIAIVVVILVITAVITWLAKLGIGHRRFRREYDVLSGIQEAEKHANTP